MIRFETVQKARPMGPLSQRVMVALTLLLTPLATGCMPETPETMLSWDVNDRLPAAHHAPARARTYVYQDRQARLVRPTPRPAPNYVTRNVTPYPPTARPVAYQPAPRQIDPSPASSMAFIWPVNGTVISAFGATANGGRNDGINIAAAPGTPIHAAASGTVTYAGNELKGYGNLLLLQHGDGYVTAYAHAEKLLVGRGDFVVKGQVIGYAGQTGDVSSPQLHFEIRHDTTPVNPRVYLTTQQARS
jgi:murein DD-endopeptidase MepM/ murein hydrolase activator NlpD